MLKVSKLSLLTICVSLVVLPAKAAMRQYHASVETSKWEITQRSRLACTLSHTLPGYGHAEFTSEASKQLNMEFLLDMQMLPKTFSTAAVYSVPPAWMPGVQARQIDEMTIRTQYDGDLPERTAWTMLSELEKGFWPTIYYQDWYNPVDKIAVGLNASNFMSVYKDFVGCVSNLLPYSFEDISYTVLSYEKNSTKLSKYSQKRLAMIGEYLSEDAQLELVLLDGYTDSYGGSWNNQQLSIKRADEVKRYLTSFGVAEDRIAITGHGEKRHIAPNTTSHSRATNRRVVVRMAKS